MSPAADHLRDRAESYGRDAHTFRAEGDLAMAAAYQAIAGELRDTAAAVEQLQVWGSDCAECGNATHRSQRCDICGSEETTFPLFYYATTNQPARL